MMFKQPLKPIGIRIIHLSLPLRSLRSLRLNHSQKTVNYLNPQTDNYL